MSDAFSIIILPQLISGTPSSSLPLQSGKGLRFSWQVSGRAGLSILDGGGNRDPEGWDIGRHCDGRP